MHPLPPELLFAIFKACTCLGQAHESGPRRHQPIVLSHVCRQWRSIAVAESSLWTDVRIDGTSSIYRLYLKRSRPRLVDLTITCTSQDGMRVAKFAQIELCRPDVQAHMESRIRSLHIVTWSEEELEQLMQFLDGYSFHHLVSLHVEVDSSLNLRPLSLEWWSHRHSHTPILPGHIPRVSAISLVNKCTDCLGDTTALTRLDLGAYPGPFDCTVLERVIQSSPRLSMLVLGEMDFLWHRQHESRSQIDVSQIKHLSIASSTFSRKRVLGIGPRCYCLLRNLVEGNLQRLDIVGGHHEALCHLLPSMKRRGPRNTPLQLTLHPSMLGLAQGLPSNIVQVLAYQGVERRE
ncbi:hypothetical protein NMY22_g7469 [Coprinellus aureogranulatus]|nr:hypothetical protein NMY22_g7469 [Coprinellus aureogranulatus]